MNRFHSFVFTLACIGLLSSQSFAQVSISAFNSPYTQDFNTLINTGTGTWTDNSTISDWYHDRTGSGTTIVAATGSSNSGQLYSFGSSSSSERALGSVGSGNSAAGDFWWGVRLVNNTGNAITSLSIQYAGEQWRYSGTAAAQTVVFSYQTGTNLTSLTSGSWTTVSSLNFTSPIVSGSTGALDGNLPANRTIKAGVVPVSIPAGQEVMLRWFDDNHSGSDHGLSTDDFSVTAYGSAGPTSVQFASATSAFAENAGTVNIAVSITNPDASNATTVQVALTGGTGVNGTDISPAYTTQTLTFPAGSSADQSISVTIVDNSTFDGDRTFEFGLQNVAGGNSAALASPTQHTMTIQENDPPPTPTVIVNEYFNAYGNLSTDEAVELYVVEDGLDMRGYVLADATSSGNTYPYGTVTFSNDALWSNLQAGTIIVLGGMFSVPIQDVDASDGLIKVQIPDRNNSNQYFTAGSNRISIAGSSDAISISNSGNGFIHGLAHGNNNSNTLPVNRHGWHNSGISSTESCFFSRSGAPMTTGDFLVDLYTAEGAASLGAANDADGNLAYLRVLRSRYITTNRSMAGTFFWDIVIDGGYTDFTGPVNICNSLLIAQGTLNESNKGLSLDANGNAQNGAGAGNITVGDDITGDATLVLTLVPTLITGTEDYDHGDALVHYNSTVAQTVRPETYHHLTFSNGGQSNPKTVAGILTVNGDLTINSNTWLLVNEPRVITLGPAGEYINNGRFLGSIQSTRDINFWGMNEDFGGIGFTIETEGDINAPTSALTLPASLLTLPGVTTVKMTEGDFIWVSDLPSIQRYYNVSAAAGTDNSVRVIVGYDEVDLAGQTEANLTLQHSSDAGTNWTQPGGTLTTGANTIELTNQTFVNGLWTMHANPPRGTIAADPTVLSYEAEELGTLPASQTVDVWNASSGGSIIEWTATASTGEVPTWLSVSPVPAEGINAGTFTVNIDRTDLTPGVYSGLITIGDPHATNHPFEIPVTCTVHEQRKISIGSDPLVIKLSYKKPNLTYAVTVFNSGGSFGPGEIVWTATTATDWMELIADSGLEGDDLEIKLGTLLKPIGTYYGELTIEGTNSVLGTPILNSPLVVQVVLEIEPGTETVASIGPLAAGMSHTFFNSEGHRIATVNVTSGTVTSMSLKLRPYEPAQNIHRLQYVWRHYIFEATGSYQADFTLHYTLHELWMMGITEPEGLRVWRQDPALYSWYPTAGFSTPVEQSVTSLGNSDLSGIWGMAMPYTTAPSRIFNAKAVWVDTKTSQLNWQTGEPPTEFGYLVERAIAGRDDWSAIGIVPRSENGLYEFIDQASSSLSYKYRLLNFDNRGNAYESDPINLSTLGITGMNTDPSITSYELSQNAPNPVPPGGMTTIGLSLPSESNVSLKLYDSRGRELRSLRDGRMGAGRHSIRLNTTSLRNGLYFYRLSSRHGTLTRTMMIVK